MPFVRSAPVRRLAAIVFFGLAASSAVRAEDPLLGRIKVIKCVGCTPGTVDLVIHDPIDVRDFEVRINESDYQKIITPLPGKTIYEKDGCFYWFDRPKHSKAPAAKPAAKPVGSEKAATTEGAQAGDSGPAETPVAAEDQGTPSRCLPFSRVEAGSSRNGQAED